MLYGKLVFEIVAVELVQELDNATWGNVNIVICHVIELEKIKVLSSCLSDELKHVSLSAAASDGFFRSVGCLGRSQLLELFEDALSCDLVRNIFL